MKMNAPSIATAAQRTKGLLVLNRSTRGWGQRRWGQETDGGKWTTSPCISILTNRILLWQQAQGMTTAQLQPTQQQQR